MIRLSVRSIPNIVSDTDAYNNPTNIDDMIETIEQLLTDETLRQHLIVAGREWIKAFSWEHSAAKTMEVYRIVLA